MKLFSCLGLVLSLCWISTISAQRRGSGDSITVVPDFPLAEDAITLELRGTSPSSQSLLFDTTHELQGSTLRVDTTLDPGTFAVGSGYGDDYELGQLLPGTYTVEEWIQCWQEGPVGEPYLAATTTLIVGGGTVPAIPTLSEAGMGLLLTSLVLAAMFLMRRRPV